MLQPSGTFSRAKTDCAMREGYCGLQRREDDAQADAVQLSSRKRSNQTWLTFAKWDDFWLCPTLDVTDPDPQTPMTRSERQL